MKRLVFALALALVCCDPPAPTQTPPPVASRAAASSASASSSAPMPTQNIDVRVEFEHTSDQYSSYIVAYLTIPPMGVHATLFTVPFPYQCMRTEADAADALVFQCLGDDSGGFASVRIENGHVIATSRDYGHIHADKVVKDLALPPNVTATIFAPSKFPQEH